MDYKNILLGLEFWIAGFPVVSILDHNFDNFFIIRMSFFSMFILCIIHYYIYKIYVKYVKIQGTYKIESDLVTFSLILLMILEICYMNSLWFYPDYFKDENQVSSFFFGLCLPIIITSSLILVFTSIFKFIDIFCMISLIYKNKNKNEMNENTVSLIV